MKVWDLRNDQDVPATTIMLSEQAKVNFCYLKYSDVYYLEHSCIIIY